MKRALRIVGYMLGGLFLVAAIGIGALYVYISNPSSEPRPLPSALVDIDSPRGAELLAIATSKADHTALTAAFQPQQKGSWCGVASAVIALRALGITPNLTQSSFFTDSTDAIRSELAITFGGMNLDQLGALLQAHGAHTTVVHAADTDADAFRGALARNLNNADDALLVNYFRAKVGQGDMGHISPVAAFDKKSDSVLILDTATYKWPATWVPIADLFDAMNTIDSSSDKTRGYVEVARP